MTAPTPPKTARGTLSVHPRGFGFLDLDDRDESAFVSPPELRGYLAGDEVEATLREDDRGWSASDLRLVRRWRERLFGVVVSKRGELSLRPEDRVCNCDWPLKGAPKGTKADDLVVARLTPGDSALTYERGVAPEDARLTATLIRWGVREGYPAVPKRAPKDGAQRRDLRELPTVTIDAPRSRDLDDALAALPAQDDGAVRVLVSIADVDAFVPLGSALDEEARQRATTVYLPGHVVPMLPRELSEDRLSLLPEQDRLAMTVEMRIDPDGVVTARDLYASTIRSHARLSYKGVSAYLERGDVSEVPEGVRETLRWLRTAASRLGVSRSARGGVHLQREEVGLVLDDEGRPTGIEVRQETSAHRLVERLMVAANEAVAAWLSSRGLPALYRVQDEPEPERVARLTEFARNFGFEAAFGSRLSPRGLAAFEEQFKSSSVAPQVRTVLRRVLGRARYQVDPAGHFGLASPGYLHFTSPIRRYADLCVHRVVKAHLAGDREQVAGDPRLAELGQAVSQIASRASRAEDDRRRQLVAELLSERLGEAYVGHVIAIKRNRLVLQLEGLGARGSVAADSLPGGPYEFDEDRESLVGKTSRYVVGQRLDLVLREADPTDGRLDFEVAPSD